MKPIDVNDAKAFQIHAVQASHKQPVVALLWGDSCAPCASLKPKLETLSDLHNFPLVRINAPRVMEVAKEFRVRTVPTVIVFNRGIDIWRFSGDKPQDDLKVILARAGAFQQPLSGV